MVGSRKSYRKRAFHRPSNAVGLQYELLLDFIERERENLARRSEDVLRKQCDTLEENLREAHSFVNFSTSDSPLVAPATRLLLAEQKVNQLRQEVERIYRSRPLPWRLIASGVSPQLRQELQIAEAEWESAKSHWRLQQTRYPKRTNPSTRFSNVEQARAFIARAESARIVLHSAMIGEVRKAELERQERDRVQAELYRNSVRSGAKTVIKTLRRDHPCPYCGGPLGDNLEADHIHPVSHGGQSTDDNMVYVCFSCNKAKSSKTLREFILRQGFDREVVEKRLLALGKRI